MLLLFKLVGLNQAHLHSLLTPLSSYLQRIRVGYAYASHEREDGDEENRVHASSSTEIHSVH